MIPEPSGDFAVVRTWTTPSAFYGTDEPLLYVKWPSGYWRTEGDECGWSWDQVTRYAERVEVVRDGVTLMAAP